MMVHRTFILEVVPPAKPITGLFLANVHRVSTEWGLESKGAVIHLGDIHESAESCKTKGFGFVGSCGWGVGGARCVSEES